MKNYENWMCPMMMEEDDDKDFEEMYPRLYHEVLPIVQRHCDKMEEKHGEMHLPENEEIEEIFDDILEEVEHDVENMMKNDRNEDLTRQIPGRRVMRDFLGTMYIDEMRRRRRRRRRRPYPPYPPYGRPPYPHYGRPGYPGYPPYPPYGRPGYQGYPPYPGY